METTGDLDETGLACLYFDFKSWTKEKCLCEKHNARQHLSKVPSGLPVWVARQIRFVFVCSVPIGTLSEFVY